MYSDIQWSIGHLKWTCSHMADSTDRTVFCHMNTWVKMWFWDIYLNIVSPGFSDLFHTKVRNTMGPELSWGVSIGSCTDWSREVFLVTFICLVAHCWPGLSISCQSHWAVLRSSYSIPKTHLKYHQFGGTLLARLEHLLPIALSSIAFLIFHTQNPYEISSLS